MKYLLLLIINFQIISYTFSQGFYHHFIDPNLSQVGYNILLKGNNYFISIKGSESKIIKMDLSGNIITEKTFFQEYESGINNMLINRNNEIVMYCYEWPTENQIITYLIKIDNDLNIISQKIIDTNKQYVLSKFIEDNIGNIVGCGYYNKTNPNEQKPIIFKFDSNLDSIKFIETPFYGMFYDIKENLNKTKYYISTDVNIDPFTGNMKIAEYNHNLEMDTAYQYDQYNINHLGWQNQLEWYKNKELLIAGLLVYPSGSWQDEASAIIKIDTNFTTKKFRKFGHQDTSEYPAFARSIAITHDNYIYNCATSNIYNMNFWPYQQQPSWVMINKVDSNLNVVWKKFYGGDAFYSTNDIIATPDGGCIVTGYRYDHLTQNQETDAFILKIDQNGLITSNKETQQIKSYNAIVYPNPAKDKLTFRIAENFTNSEITINDLSGKQIQTIANVSSIENIDISSFSNGIYVFTIKNNNQIIETGRFVKE